MEEEVEVVPATQECEPNRGVSREETREKVMLEEKSSSKEIVGIVASEEESEEREEGMQAKQTLEEGKGVDGSKGSNTNNNKRKAKGVWKRRAREQGKKGELVIDLSPSKRLLRLGVDKEEEERVGKKAKGVEGCMAEIVEGYSFEKVEVVKQPHLSP